MAFHPDLRLLAASRDRDLTPEARGAVSQLSASCDVDLTVAHVTTDGDVPAPPVPFDFELHAAPRRLQRRELAGPDAARTLARLCADEPFDLVLAPTRRQGVAWPRLRGSFRERLLRLSATPLWTAGPGVPGRHFHRPIRSVACLLDFDANPERLLQRAAAFARRMDARLHVLAVLPPVDESTLALVLTSDTPLLPSAAVARIEQLCAGRPSPMVDVVVDGKRRGLGRLVEMALPDVLFVRSHQWSGGWPFSGSRHLDTLRCPVIRVPDEVSTMDWTFERATAASRLARAGERVPAKGVVEDAWPAGAPSRLG
jgi:hypothetical protein